MKGEDFHARRETFGLETKNPWAMGAVRMLLNTPRAYAPLVDAWELRNPGIGRALARLEKLGFASHQPEVVVDTRSGQNQDRRSTPVNRFRTTSKGARLTAAAQDDIRVLESDLFPRTARHNTTGLLKMLHAFNLADSHAKYGMSVPHARQLSGLPDSNVKWWVHRLVTDGYLKKLPNKLADVRAVVPSHWRPTSSLARQLRLVVDAFDAVPNSLKIQLKLGRDRFLKDIDPARIGITGATDFDHDVECQRVLATLMRSPSCLTDGLFAIEPRFVLPLNVDTDPWEISESGDQPLYYQPDAELREQWDGRVARTILEYERYQSRRDAWNHIERFLGYLATSTMPLEPAVLRFVVDSKPRENSYVELIEAFGDYCIDHTERTPKNPVMLAVSSTPRLAEAKDPMAASSWFRVELPQPDRADTARRPVLHPANDSPYDDYFSRR